MGFVALLDPVERGGGQEVVAPAQEPAGTGDDPAAPVAKHVHVVEDVEDLPLDLRVGERSAPSFSGSAPASAARRSPKSALSWVVAYSRSFSSRSIVNQMCGSISVVSVDACKSSEKRRSAKLSEVDVPFDRGDLAELFGEVGSAGGHRLVLAAGARIDVGRAGLSSRASYSGRYSRTAADPAEAIGELGEHLVDFAVMLALRPRSASRRRRSTARCRCR